MAQDKRAASVEPSTGGVRLDRVDHLLDNLGAGTMTKPRFIAEDTFLGLLAEIPRQRGGGNYGDAHGDPATVYRDLSNFVVALLARTPRQQLVTMFNEVGLGGTIQGLEWQRAARLWCERFKPELLADLPAE